jgi:hypothetical protein
MRVMQVKNHYMTKESYTEAGYFDGSLEEKSKREGDLAVKRLIDSGLDGSSVLCVLIGAQTFARPWVHYEIFKSIELGMGVFGVRIHRLNDPRSGNDTPGTSPFDVLGYSENSVGQKIPMIAYTNGWQNAPHLSPIATPTAIYLRKAGRPILNSLFSVYDWVLDGGYYNFATWIELAARQAGR